MLGANSPENLIELCENLAEQNATGVLISGGCDSTGQVMLEPYLGSLAEIKQRTKLILNVHTGLLSPAMAKEIAKAGVDIASVDIVGDHDTLREVYGLKHSLNEYKESLTLMKAEGMKKIVPHICIGLNYGKIKGEYQAIDMISEIEIAGLVFLVLIPTKGSRMEGCAPPEIEEVLKVIRYAKSKLDDKPIYLGCMRPRANKFRAYTQELEVRLIDAGIHGIVLPAKKTIEYLQKLVWEQKIKLETYKICCAV